jgi:hypothetical protein
MQNNKEKFLIDIYFDESKMNVWKEKCTKSSDFISNKIKSKSDLIASEKNKIRNEKNSNILVLKEDWNNIMSEFESFTNEKEIGIQSIFSNFSEENKKFKRLLNNLRENILNNNQNPTNNNNINSNINIDNNNNFSLDEILDEIKLYKTKIPNIKNLLISYRTAMESIEEFSLKMKNLLVKSTVNINLVFTNYFNIKKNLLEIIEKLDKYSEGIKNLVKDFSYLLNPSKFPDAYNSSLMEIKRRIIFNKKITKDFDKLKQIVSKENLNRKQFIQDYGKYLTHDYVPQLKFSDLDLKIDINNQDEIKNLPFILDEDEENAMNNNYIFLEYDDILLENNLQNSNINIISRQNSIMSNLNNNTNTNNNTNINTNTNTKNDDSNNNIYKGINLNLSNGNANPEEIIRNLNMKINEFEIMLKVKESEIKKLYTKIDQKERKITFMHSEIDKLSGNLDTINDNYLKQLNFKEQKLRDKNLQCENLLKIANNKTGDKLDNCPVCKDVAMNNIDYQGWGNYIKDYHEKIIEKNKLMSKLESRYNELVIQTVYIKKTFFSHLNSSVEIKNKELSYIKENYENKLMLMEDLLSFEKNRVENFLGKKEKEEQNNFEEKYKTNENIIIHLELKIKEQLKQIEYIENENRKNFNDKENQRKINEDMKIKENSLNVEIKLKENKIESLKNDIKNLEKIIDAQKKSINQINEEALSKLKENTNLKMLVDLKEKNIEDLEKKIEYLNKNHIEEIEDLKKIHKENNDKLNSQLDEYASKSIEKLKMIEEHKKKNLDLVKLVEKKNEDIKNLNNELQIISKSQNEMDLLRNKMDHLEDLNANENLKLKKKLEEIQIILTEKDKKLQVCNFYYIFYYIFNNSLILRTLMN